MKIPNHNPAATARALSHALSRRPDPSFPLAGSREYAPGRRPI